MSWLVDEYPVLFHATKSKWLDGILREGISPAHCGRISGTDFIRPAEKTVYLSRHAGSSNLNTRLFEDNDPLVILSVQTDGIDESLIYPDDSIYVGFAEEHFLVDVQDVMEAMKCSPRKARRLLERWEACYDHELPAAMKCLWQWSLAEEGEIAVAQTIAPSSIVAVHDYESGREVLIEPADIRHGAMELKF